MKIKFNRKEFESFYKNNKIVKNYDKNRLSTLKKRVVRRLERATSIKYIKKGYKILEIGVGTGYITKSLLNYGPVVGIDSSKLMLKKARNNLIKKKANLELINDSIFSFNLNKKFDYIVTYRVFMHFNKKNINKSLLNIQKHLTHGSYLVFDLPSKSFLKRIIYYLKLNFIKGEEIYNYSYSKNDIFSMFKNYDFKIVDVLAIDHATIFLPIYVLFNNMKSGQYIENFICNVEKRLFDLHCLNTRWIVILKKK